MRPVLRHVRVPAVAVVRPVRDGAAWQGWRAQTVCAAEEFFAREDLDRTPWNAVVDCGSEVVGRLELSLAPDGFPWDAPLRVEAKFAESLYELRRACDATPDGGLSRAWLQDFVVVVDGPVTRVRFPRRAAFRYVRLRVWGMVRARWRLAGLFCVTETSAPPPPAAIRGGENALDAEIASVSVRTLQWCMQDVFEDGPKRDRRLWLGDLRLQALSAYSLWRGTAGFSAAAALVRRCLLLFASAARDEDGAVPGCLYPRDPDPPEAGNFLFDYQALFGDVLLDYLDATGDASTARDLFPAALRQTRLALAEIDPATGLFRDSGKHWLFLDWKDGLDKTCGEHGVVVYSALRTRELALRLGFHRETSDLPARMAKLRRAARAAWRDPANGYFVSGPDLQVSWASQIWAVLSGICPARQAPSLLRRTLTDRVIVGTGGPYLCNQMLLALMRFGMAREALSLVRSFWGGMVERGATTFWEVFDPQDPFRSPYGNPAMNSGCHAWSVPVWFPRKGRCLGRRR